MIQYDPKVIDEFANRLYKKARSTIAIFTVFGFLVGAGIGGMIFLAASKAQGSGVGALIVLVILTLIGYAIGSERAFRLKLEAQTALCQVQIEQNTRQRGTPS